VSRAEYSCHRLHGTRQGVPRQPNDAINVTKKGQGGWHTVIVPRFEPFAALRFSDSANLAALCSPPYDVQSVKDRERFGLRHENNIVHIDMPIGNDNDDMRYRTANDIMQSWKASGVLYQDDAPTFTIYRMEYRDALGRQRRTAGVLGALEVVDDGAGGVLPHERTTPKAKTDRLQLTRATRANLSPVWGLSLAEGLSAMLAEPAESLGQFIDDHGVTHTVERVSDKARVEAISTIVSSQSVVIADGHHRYAISRSYRDEMRAETLRLDTPAELTLTYVNELLEEQLSVAAIHRLYRDVNLHDLTNALRHSFIMEPAGTLDTSVLSAMDTRGALVLLMGDGSGTWLLPRKEAFTGVRDLDSAKLEHALATLPHTVDYQHGFEEVQHAVSSGDHTAAILIRPVTVDEIRRTAHEGLLMPPKSTFFTPKLQTGLVLRELY